MLEGIDGLARFFEVVAPDVGDGHDGVGVVVVAFDKFLVVFDGLRVVALGDFFFCGEAEVVGLEVVGFVNAVGKAFGEVGEGVPVGEEASVEDGDDEGDGGGADGVDEFLAFFVVVVEVGEFVVGGIIIFFFFRGADVVDDGCDDNQDGEDAEVEFEFSIHAMWR